MSFAQWFRPLLLSTLLCAGALVSPPTPAQGLLSCYVLGDSIAVGTAQKLPWCLSDAKVGLNTRQAVTRFAQVPRADVTIISLGINDRGTHLPTVKNLAQIRSKITSQRVIWILPADANKSADILQVARYYRDQTIDLNSPSFARYLSGADHLHPSGKGYALVANQTRYLAYAPVL